MIEIKMRYSGYVLVSLDIETLEGINLDGLYLHHADFVNANLDHASLRNANLDSAEFSGANLSYADLSGADLSNAKLDNANLSYTKFVDAEIIGAIFDNSCLDNADLHNADVALSQMHNASVRSADLNVANMRKWIKPPPIQTSSNGKVLNSSLYYMHKFGNPLPVLYGTVYDENTKWPKGFDPEKHGAIYSKSNQQGQDKIHNPIIRNAKKYFKSIIQMIKKS